LRRCAALAAAALGLIAALPAPAGAATHTLTVNKWGTGSGTVTSSPAGIDCGQSCWAKYESGTEVTLTGSPGPNTAAVKWSGCDSVNAEGRCLVTIGSAREVKASFDIGKPELKVIKTGSGPGTVSSSPGGIDCGLTCAAKFSQGQTVALSATPGAGSEAVKWSGCDSLDGEGRCLVAMSGAREVKATFNLPSHTLTVKKAGQGTGTVTSSPAGIECGEFCAEGFPIGSSVLLEASPGLHSEAPTWSGCDSVAAGKCKVTMSEARAVTASFGLKPGFALHAVAVAKIGTGTGSVSASSGAISCGAICSGEYVTGTVLTLTATPAPGSVFSHFSGGSCAGAEPCTRTINSARTVKAVFTAVGQRTLTVGKAGTGQGTVSSRPLGSGIDCGATCSASLAAGTKLTLVAAAAEGSSFTGWSGACTGTGLCKVTLGEAREVTASFEGPAAATAATGLAVIPAAARVRGGKARLKILCNGPSACEGVLKLGAKLQPKGRPVLIGSAPFALAPRVLG